MAARGGADEKEKQALMYKDEQGRYVVDGDAYTSVNAAFDAFRRMYNRRQGKVGSRKLGRIASRKSIMSHRGMDFYKGYVEDLNEEFKDTAKVKCYIAGLIGISYYYLYDEQHFDPAFQHYDDEKRERYLDWLIAAGTTAVRMCGRMDRLVVRTVHGMKYGHYVGYKRRRRTKKK